MAIKDIDSDGIQQRFIENVSAGGGSLNEKLWYRSVGERVV